MRALGPAFGALLTIALSLVASKLMAITIPFDIDGQIQETEDLNNIPREKLSADHIIGYYFAQLEHWKVAIKDIERKAASKARWVFAAQLMLICTIVLFMMLFVVTIKSA